MQPLFFAAHSNSRGTSQAQWSFSPLEGSWCSPEGTELSAGVTGLSGHLCQNEEKNHLHVFSSCFFWRFAFLPAPLSCAVQSFDVTALRCRVGSVQTERAESDLKGGKRFRLGEQGLSSWAGKE